MLTSGASWTKGVVIPIVGANVIESISGKIVIDTIVVESLVPTGFTYELFLFSDASGLIELGRFRFAITGDLILSLKKIDVHDALYGALACQAAGAKATISIQYRIV
jgi:hypothetical protein